MASGGHKPKSSASEPRQRTSWKRTTSMSDKEDNFSIHSIPNELRPNNWDFSDWQPSAPIDQTKRRKKGNPEWEREQSLSQDSPPPSERQHGTPRTFPRTKITPSTPTSQRVALENLRLHMTFSDADDAVSNEGERNNDRNLLGRRGNLAQQAAGANSQLPRQQVNSREDRSNRNNNKDENLRDGKPDSSHIVGRLMQIRDYIKQASSMMESLKKSKDPCNEGSRMVLDIVAEMVTEWKQRENDCLETLKELWPGYKEEMERLKKLLDHLREQEQGYTCLLQNVLSVRDENNLANGTNGLSREQTPNLDSVDDTQSLDLDVRSEASEIERVLNLVPEVRYLKPGTWDRVPSASSRPFIEDKLGLASDNDDDEEEQEDDDEEEDEEENENAAQSESSDNSSTMDDTVVSGRKHPEWDFELGEEELAAGGMANPKEAAEQLLALRQQQELLTKLVEQQEQMRALKGRQSALLALQQDAEMRLTTARTKSNEAHAFSNALDEVATTMATRADAMTAANDKAGKQPDAELSDLKQQLQYLRNELKSQSPKQDERAPQHSRQERQERRTVQGPRQRDRGVQNQRREERESQVAIQETLAAAAAAAAQRQEERPRNPQLSSIPPEQMSGDQLQEQLQDLLGKKEKLDELLQTEFYTPSTGPVEQDLTRDQLQNKLRDLQTKKRKMDEMLNELQSLRADPFSLSVMAAPPAAPPVPQSTVAEIQTNEGHAEAALARAEGSEDMANGVLGVLEARQKLTKLNEVRQRLGQLKSLVEYYQAADPSSPQRPDNEDQSSLPVYSDYEETEEEAEVTRDRGPGPRPEGGRQAPVANVTVKPGQQKPLQQQSDENNSSTESGDETDSQLSSLGPWGDDPEIQEKVKKLKAAKDKLHRLQSLVAMVQDSPEVVQDLPDNIAEIAASIEDVESQFTQTDDRNNASVSEGEIPIQPAERDAYYQTKLQEQLEELTTLKDEKQRLLNIQEQLQTLHQRFQQADRQASEERSQPPQPKSQERERPRGTQQTEESTTQQSTGPSVTFSSNEEVYDKMRKQRMLREELRDKKKQLESIMKKDRNKRQYIKNQDNQSDTVSYTTDNFGVSASADATMATWGGSTVDNMESITEDGVADQQENDDDDEDAYPSDGILQVEEEEEENNSDNETYTIEEDVRQRREARSMARPAAKQAQKSAKSKRTFPRPQKAQGGARPKERKEAWTSSQQPDFSRWSRTTGETGTGRNNKSKQENYRSAEEIIEEDEADGSKSADTSIQVLQQQLEQTSMLCQTLLQEQQGQGSMNRLGSSGGFSMRGSTMDLQQQFQQQQLMMSLNQCYQQMGLQQLEMQNMQRQMQGLVLQVTDNVDINDSGMSSDLRFRSMQSLLSPMNPRMSPHVGAYGADPYKFSPQIPPYPNYYQENPMQRMSENAMRGGGTMMGEDNVFEPKPFSSQSKPVAESYPERQRNTSGAKHGRGARQSKSETYQQKSKPKMASPQMAGSTAATQTRLGGSQNFQSAGMGEDSEGPVPPLDLETVRQRRREFLRRNLPVVMARNNFQVDTGQGGDGDGSQNVDEDDDDDDDQMYRPGLSGGISGAGFLEGNGSVTSSVRSGVAAMAQAISSQQSTQTRERERQDSQQDSDDPNELSLFETLRETIYSEVATLISQNENRPHYLIELFRELQRLSTDYLRQRVLYDVKDVISKFLVDENTESVAAPPPRWMNPSMGNFTAEELTPSESLVTSDDEEIKYLLQAKLNERATAAKRSGKKPQLLKSGSMKNDEFDYQEVAEVASSVSTPSASYWESPFAQDSLGETVIHLDKTLQKMREYEKRLTEKGVRSKSSDKRGPDDMGCSSSAMDEGSQSSITSDVPYPRIDTQQLDQQIKAIMTEVIPVIKEHMDNMCSPQLLAYIKRLVLSLTRQYDSGQEFARFFHRQLGSILQDSLAKFEGRKMRECGEDLIVDMSEVLFNELAFFRLMQDLDDPAIAEKMKQQNKILSDSEFEEDDKVEDVQSDESDTTETATNSDTEDETKVTQTEEEELGKARDDAFASEMEVIDADDKDDDLDSPYRAVQIELAVSETKPYTRIGSDEDDDDADESQSNEDPSETAVSLNAKRTDYYDDDFEEDEDSEKQDGTTRETPIEKDSTPPAQADQGDADQGAGSATSSASTAEPDNNNGDVLSSDIEVITMDDLPPSMTVMSQEELEEKVTGEQQANSGATAVLDTINPTEELAGDPQFLKGPEEASG